VSFGFGNLHGNECAINLKSIMLLSLLNSQRIGNNYATSTSIVRSCDVLLKSLPFMSSVS